MGQSPETPTYGRDKRPAALEPAAFFLNKAGLSILLVILLLAAWNSQLIMVVITGLVLCAAGLTKLWSHWSMAGVQCRRVLDERRIFPGEQTRVKLELTNRKILPLPWVQIDDEIPYRLTTDGASAAAERPGFTTISKTASLLWYRKISWHYQLRAEKRGYYRLGGLTISSGDIFGFYPRSSVQPAEDAIIVYPQLYAITPPPLPSVFPLGELKSERRIFEDTTRSVGVREYAPGDSFRYIHWKASARHQELQVKVFEPTTTLKAVIFLGVDTFPRYRTDEEDDFELGVSVAASVANYIIQKHCPVGLFVNTCQTDSSQPVRIPTSSSPHHLVSLLEALAKTTLTVSSPFEEFIQNERGNLTWGATVILIISRPESSLAGLLASLRQAGHKTLVIQIGQEYSCEADATDWYNVRRSDGSIGFLRKEMR